MLAIGIPLSLTVSCARDRTVDYAAYERIPIRPVSAALRVVVMSNPLTRKAGFYGRYGGPGNYGGQPVDEMDDLFRRHDIVYQLARTRKTMVGADHCLVARLSMLDSRRLSSESVAFRDRAIRFFNSPISHVVGKPLSTCYTWREPKGCYFQGPEVVREFFSEEHCGMPEAGGGRVAER